MLLTERFCKQKNKQKAHNGKKGGWWCEIELGLIESEQAMESTELE